MRTPIVAGNWKLNGSRQSARDLAAGVATGAPKSGVEVVVCPVSLHIPEVAAAVEGSVVALGGQNACENESGAFTAEVSSSMLAEFGCRYVIIGHSERRSLYGESDADCAARGKAVIDAGLTPMFCIGETLEQRESEETIAVLHRQLNALVEASGDDVFGKCVIAYEPVWAIGTGKTASPGQAQAVHEAIRQYVAGLDGTAASSVRIIYGGSVKPDNAAELFAQPDIDGGLIGGAALKAEDFLAICNAAAEK